ncbi:beta-ketoacyl-[acyl-carrier-protein] synthase family protein [Schlesneria sp.]|uniref:beta-ketoacyl-[acyl-carrier-protein] synthase family protein n=1 Tax=Schlesneria sp. TaxID=2762018 RepID=UPI002F101597
MTKSSESREVVITGVGIVSPIGIGVDEFWKNLSTGQSGIRYGKLFPGFAAPDGVCAEVLDFTDESARKVYLKEQRKNLKAMCREIQLGVASALLALQNSAIDLSQINHERLGVEFGANLMLSPPEVLLEGCEACCEEGTTKFQPSEWGQKGLTKLEPLWLLRYLPNMPACHISISADARGPSNSLTLDDASGNTVIGEAMRILLRGAADMMIVGVTGTTLHPIKTLHQALWDDLARTPAEPERRARPFDLNRAGRVVAEGSCSFILEDRAHAEERGAKIWGRVLGTGSSCVTNTNQEANYRLALANAMRGALRDANLTPDQIGHINAHGLGTKEVDIAEAAAIHDVFGSDLGRKIPVTAIKSFIGNSGAGSGLLELAASVVSLTHGVIPQTLNYEKPDPACPLNIVVGQPQPTSNNVVLSINVTKIGQAAASIVKVGA